MEMVEAGEKERSGDVVTDWRRRERLKMPSVSMLWISLTSITTAGTREPSKLVRAVPASPTAFLSATKAVPPWQKRESTRERGTLREFPSTLREMRVELAGRPVSCVMLTPEGQTARAPLLAQSKGKRTRTPCPAVGWLVPPA